MGISMVNQHNVNVKGEMFRILFYKIVESTGIYIAKDSVRRK